MILQAHIRKLSPSKLVCYIFLICCVWTIFNLGKWKSTDVLNWDKSGYYLYLPALFIYHDLAELNFYPDVEKKYHFTGDEEWYGLHPVGDLNNRTNKYSCGVALFELPAFLIAHAYVSLSRADLADGFSPPYQMAIQLASVFISFLGLLFLRMFLREYGIRDRTIEVVLIILAFGTNFYYYSAFEQGMSHGFSFFLISAILCLTQRLYNTGGIKYFALLGFALGWTTLIRPVDILIVAIPLFWLGSNKKLLYSALQYKWPILLLVLCFLIPWLPQLLYWKLTTGQFIYYSYAEEGFNFRNPEVINGLFSYRKGWFVYTPLALVGIIFLIVGAGMDKFKEYCRSVLLFYIPYLVIVFSWWQWYYGGGFGSRVMINTLPLLALPFSILVMKLKKLRLPLRWTFWISISCLIALNLFHSWQYSRVIIHWDSMNKAYYWRVFLKTEATDEDRKLLEDKYH